MEEFVGERIEVETDGKSPVPVSFAWRGHVYAVAEVVQEWVDAGFGMLPPGSRKWYNRQHRRYYVVRTRSGETFKIYMDYADRAHKTWWVVSRVEE